MYKKIIPHVSPNVLPYLFLTSLFPSKNTAPLLIWLFLKMDKELPEPVSGTSPLSTYCWGSLFLFCLCSSSLPASPSDSANGNKITRLQRKSEDIFPTSPPGLSVERPPLRPAECKSLEKVNQANVLWPVECLQVFCSFFLSLEG